MVDYVKKKSRKDARNEGCVVHELLITPQTCTSLVVYQSI